MDFQDYQAITGISCSSSREAVVYSQLMRSQALLEDLLGYTLDQTLTNENEYIETGKLVDGCPCLCNSINEADLLPADPVITAYRLFPYTAKDAYLAIDPATAVHSVKLVKNGVTYRTLDEDDYRVDFKRGITKYLEQCHRWCQCRVECDCVQLAVDADWLWTEDQTLPMDLQILLSDMATYYADPRTGIKKETLGPHTYERFDQDAPEQMSVNLSIIQRYAGPNGSAFVMPN